jgi:uncharacterized protein
MLLDTNVLVYAHRSDDIRHDRSQRWVQAMVNGSQAYAVSDFAVLGMIRIVTNPRIYADPSPLKDALAFAGEVRDQPHALVVSPGPRFWTIFTGLCREAKACGNLIPDAYLAALAIEHGCEVITHDNDFGKFPGLSWNCPFKALPRIGVTPHRRYPRAGVTPAPATRAARFIRINSTHLRAAPPLTHDLVPLV